MPFDTLPATGTAPAPAPAAAPAPAYAEPAAAPAAAPVDAGGASPAPQTTPQTGAPAAPPAQADPLAAFLAAPDPTATGSEIPGQAPAQPGPVAYDRFYQVNERNKSLEQQLNDYRRLDPWRPVLDRITSVPGVTPESALNLFQQPQQPQGSPQERFEASLRQTGVDPLNLSDEMYEARFARWQVEDLNRQITEQRTQEQTLRQQQEASQQSQRLIAAAETQLGQITQHPTYAYLNDPVLRAVVLDNFEAGGGRIPVGQVAAALHQSIDRVVQARMTQYSAGKTADAAVPNVAGGSAPAPAAPTFDWHTASDAERERHLDAVYRASAAAA